MGAYLFVGVKGVDDVLAGVVELFVLVEGVGDVLADVELCAVVIKGVRDVLAGVELGVVSRASMTFLLHVEQGLDVLLVSRASMTCLPVWSRVLMAVFMAMGRLTGLCIFRAPPGRLELSASFLSPRALTPVSARGLLVISLQQDRAGVDIHMR